jgi:uncharacterized protein
MKVSSKTLHACLSDRMLRLIVMPTEACNFRCVYCYEDFAHGRMPATVVRGIKNLLSSRAASLDLLTLSWFGGEPLIARDIIEDIHQHVHVLIRENPGLHLSSDMTTNAYFLSRSVFEQLLACGITQYQIPFDGPEQWHDRKRKLANGKGTFARIWQNLLSMREVKGMFSVFVRLHIDMENHDSLPGFIEEYQRAFAKDLRFKLFPRRLSRLGGPNDASLPAYEDQQGRVAETELIHLANTLKIPNIPKKMISPICYAAQANSFVVRSDGRLNKCTVALEESTNQVGRLHEDGSLELTPVNLHGWMRGLVSGDKLELECPMHGLVEKTGKAAPRPAFQILAAGVLHKL